jgi:hypothetical protein
MTAIERLISVAESCRAIPGIAEAQQVFEKLRQGNTQLQTALDEYKVEQALEQAHFERIRALGEDTVEVIPDYLSAAGITRPEQLGALFGAIDGQYDDPTFPLNVIKAADRCRIKPQLDAADVTEKEDPELLYLNSAHLYLIKGK